MNILLTSAGRRAYLVEYFKQALAGGGQVHAANSEPVSTALLAADRHLVTPPIYDDTYIPFLCGYCANHQINAIVPLFDADLPVLAANRERFERVGTRIVVSPPGVIATCNDKWATFNWLTENGFAAPATFLTPAGAKQALAEGRLSWPLMLKPRWGMGSIAVYRAENKLELDVFYEKVRREISRTYLRFESAADAEHPVVIQQTLTGAEYGLDVVNDLDARHQAVIIKRKLAMRSGETDVAVTVSHRSLNQLGRRLGEALGHVGNLDVDAFVDGDTLTVLEMNARFGGGYPFSHAAGANLPLALIHWLRGEAAPPHLLRASLGVLSQKGIAVVSAPQHEFISYTRLSNHAQAAAAIRHLEQFLSLSVSAQGKNIDDYAAKLLANGHIFAAHTPNGAICGLVAAYANNAKNGAYLSFLATDLPGQGISTALLARVEALAAAHGMPQVRLRVQKPNTGAIAFYEKHGYTREPESAPAPHHYYAKPLTKFPF